MKIRKNKLNKKLLSLIAVPVAALGITGATIAMRTNDVPKTETATNQEQTIEQQASEPVVRAEEQVEQQTAQSNNNPVSEEENDPPAEPQPDYGEDPNIPGRFIVFDKAAVMSQAGIQESLQPDADKLITHISNWVYKWDTYGRRDICWEAPDALVAGTDYYSNPVTQVKFCKDYVDQKFGGSWSVALAELNKPH